MELIALRADRGVHHDENGGVYLWENQAMSDESELTRLRADLKVLERYECTEVAKANVRDKIAKLEAAADPWRVAKQFAEDWREIAGMLGNAAGYIDHMTAEVARLTERVAELEDVKPIADMQPPFEGPVVGFDPVLDPARVLATAVNVLGSLYKKKQSHEVWAILQNLDQDAKPYPLKKGGE